jgi:heme exporter protein B
MNPVTSVLFKDVLVELRNKETVSSMLLFGVLVLVIFNFAFEPAGAERALIAPGSLWVAFAFAGIIGLNRSLSMEIDNECLQGLLLAPLSRGDLYLAKVGSNFGFVMIAELIIIPVFVVFNNLRFDYKVAMVIGVAAIGTLGFVAIGTILSTISAGTRMREVMLPILQIPMTVPVVISAVEATSMIMRDETQGISFPLSLLGGFSIVYLTVSYLVFEYVVEE